MRQPLTLLDLPTRPRDILAHTAHRPYPLPSRPWLMRQTWSDLLFAHWPLPPEVLRALIPAGLTLDTYGGQAWIGVIPFYMSGVRGRFLPPVPGTAAFHELNVRTYVTAGDKAGIWFFSLDASNPLAVFGARLGFHLPYFNAAMSLHRDGETVNYRSHRDHSGAPPAEFRASYRPVSPVYRAEPGSLAHWLTERYCLYTQWSGRLYRSDIHHVQWPLQAAEADIARNTMVQAAGITLPDTPPLLHFARRLDMLAWYLAAV